MIRRVLLLLLFTSLAIAATHAQDNYEIQVYGSDMVAPAHTMFELHSNFTIDGSKTREYTVKKNDTVESIAKAELGSARYAPAIREANALADLDHLKAGRVIRIPEDPSNISGKVVPGTAPAATPPAVPPPVTPAGRMEAPWTWFPAPAGLLSRLSGVSQPDGASSGRASASGGRSAPLLNREGRPTRMSESPDGL